MKLTDRLKQLDTASMTSREIADILNMDYDYVRTILAQHKIPYKKVREGNRVYKPHPKESRILHHHKKGLKISEIQELTKASPETIKKIIARNK